MNKNPLVTIYMPVFNAQRYLNNSIGSILNQTFTDFEFIIIDDASTDNSLKIIKSFVKKDKRIKVLKNPINLGVSLSSNIALSIAKGQFIARMDADDISHPSRIEQQVNYLIKNPKTVALGTQCLIIDENNSITGHKTFPNQPELLKKMIFWAIPLQQPSMMINTHLLPKNFTWYCPNKTSAEEVDLIFRLMKLGVVTNLEEELLYYRHLPQSLSHQNPKQTFRFTLQSRLKALKLGFRPSLKAIILNLFQILVIYTFPNNIINGLWNIIRGTNTYSFTYKIKGFYNRISLQST